MHLNLSTGLAAQPLEVKPESIYEEHSVAVEEDGRDVAFRYRLLRPESAASTQKFPLVLFFHGGGERGTDNALQLKYFPTWIAQPKLRNKYPCFVLAPQCRPKDHLWSSVEMTTDMQAAIKALDHIIATEAVDTKRILVTGLSMGGSAAWEVAMRMPERVAAVVPVCGKSEEQYADLAKDVPLWVFHGDADKAIPVECSRAMIAALEAVGGKPRYTELQGVGHDAWTATYHNEELLDWFFKQHR